MKINQFFAETLGANVKNPRWSWGAVEPMFDRIYLRVWADQFKTIEGKEHILVDRDDYFEGYQSNGIKERRDHVQLVRDGAAGYGVVCKPNDNNEKRKICEFDSKLLLRLGRLRKHQHCTWAEIVTRVSVSELQRRPSGASTTGSDIAKLLRSKIETTTKETLIDARVGQGKFRQAVLNQWQRRCAVTGCAIEEAVRASHIKPWRESNNDERLDPDNGLPLIATLDALFDAVLISFDRTGKLLISKSIPSVEAKSLGIVNAKLRRKPSRGMETYLNLHRAKFNN
jgi:hypothetical protein